MRFAAQPTPRELVHYRRVLARRDASVCRAPGIRDAQLECGRVLWRPERRGGGAKAAFSAIQIAAISSFGAAVIPTFILQLVLLLSTATASSFLNLVS